MTPSLSHRWTTDPEYIDLLNFLIEKIENVEWPMSVNRIAREFKGESGVALTEKVLVHRISNLRTKIHSFEHIDTSTKVKMMFALSASVDADFLKELKKAAFVEVDGKKRIVHYKAIDGSLELSGDHSQSAKNRTAKLESKGSLRSMINSYFENKNDSNAAPINKEEKTMRNLIEFITEKCENVDTPLNITRLAKDFKNHFEILKPIRSIERRLEGYCREIQKVEFLGTHYTVQQLFGLSATVDPDYLEKLRKDALVNVDEKNRIIHYKANDGSLELRGDHSMSAKVKLAMRESKRSYRKLIIKYFETKDDSDATRDNDEEKEMGNFIEFITEKCKNVNSPLSIRQLTKDFNKHYGLARALLCIRHKVKGYCREIQTLDILDTPSKVKQLFCLSATLDSNFLTELRKDAVVEVDDRNRITRYTANDGVLTLHGDHSQSAKNSIGQLASKRSHRSIFNRYFEKKKDAVPENEEEREMGNFIKFITEKCNNVISPLSIRQLTKEFTNHFGISRSAVTIRTRVKAYCREIQNFKFMDTSSKVKQLFGLSAKLDSNFLKELRKDAVVEVDNLNRITNYTANNGRLTLHGEHSSLAKGKLAWIEWEKTRNAAMNSCAPEGDYDDESEKEIDNSGDDSDEYSSEEFGSDFDSDIDNNHLDAAENFMGLLDETNHFDKETPVRNRSEASIDCNFPEITENAVIKTRSGRLSKRRHLDSNFSYDLADSSSSGALMSSSSSYSKSAKHFDPPTERLRVSKMIAMREDDGIKRKKINNYTPGSSSSKQIGSSSNDSMRPTELDDYDTNYSIDDHVKLEPFRGSIQEDFDDFEEDEDIQRIPKHLQSLDEHDKIEEVPIKIEHEELKIVENPIEEVKPEIAQAHDEHNQVEEVPIKKEHEEPVEVKPETSHNPKIKFFEAIQSLILCLDNPSLSSIQSKIYQKIQKLGESNEVIMNNEISLIIDLLIARITNHSVVNLSNDAESVNFSNFLCYLKASLLNSKISGLEGLLKNISERIEESQNERVPMEKVANALAATLDIDSF